MRFKGPQSILLTHLNSPFVATTWSIIHPYRVSGGSVCLSHRSKGAAGLLFFVLNCGLYCFFHRRFCFRLWSARMVSIPGPFRHSNKSDCSVSCTGSAFWCTRPAPSASPLTFVHNLYVNIMGELVVRRYVSFPIRCQWRAAVPSILPISLVSSSSKLCPNVTFWRAVFLPIFPTSP